jgi:G:T/U-mismatch repair DNA glycosylase
VEFFTCLLWPSLHKRQKTIRLPPLAHQVQRHNKKFQPFGGVLMEAQMLDWRALSEAASREQDSDKLMELVEELNRALLRREKQLRELRSRN